MAHPLVRRLSRWLTPKFPDRCVLCGADSPGHAARFFADGQYGPLFFHLFLSFDDGKKSITAPACPGCALASRIGGLWRFAVAATFGTLAAWLLFWVVPPARAFDELKILSVVLAAIMPILAWNRLFPPKFILAADNDAGDFHFHFCDASYAAAFDALNHLPPRDPQPPDDDIDDGLPEELGTAASADRRAYSPVTGDDPANPYRRLEDARFRT